MSCSVIRYLPSPHEIIIHHTTAASHFDADQQGCKDQQVNKKSFWLTAHTDKVMAASRFPFPHVSIYLL